MRHMLGSLALGATLLAPGCGQKGPLYLPDKNVRVLTTPEAQPAPAQPAPAQPAPAQPPAQSGAAPSSGPAPQTAPVSTTPTTSATPKPTDKDGDSEAPK